MRNVGRKEEGRAEIPREGRRYSVGLKDGRTTVAAGSANESASSRDFTEF